MNRSEEKRVARGEYIQAIERGELENDAAFLFRRLDRSKVRMVRRPSATQVAEADVTKPKAPADWHGVKGA